MPGECLRDVALGQRWWLRDGFDLGEAKKEKFHTCGGPRRRPCLGQGWGRRIMVITWDFIGYRDVMGYNLLGRNEVKLGEFQQFGGVLLLEFHKIYWRCLMGYVLLGAAVLLLEVALFLW